MKTHLIKWKYALLLTVLPFFACHTQQDVQALQGNFMSSDIRKSIEKGKAIVYENATIEGDLILSEGMAAWPLTEQMANVYLEFPIVFYNCRFKGKVLAVSDDAIKVTFTRHIRFQNCTFEGEVDFRKSSFLSDVNFSGSSFEKAADFSNCGFQGLSLFRETQFLETLSLANCYFTQDLMMDKTNIRGQGNFQGAIYHQSARFSEAVFQDYADFSNQDFRSGAYFTYAQFLKRSNFSFSKFLGRADFNRLRFAEHATFEGSTFFSKLRLNASTYEQNIDLSGIRCFDQEPELKEMIPGEASRLIKD